ncbi:MAG: hypothetical protein QNJ70_01940 [Xenococcaceae cyanobacterium MO_207.B15]|nr:hypothetical protein [Xenococcaceae cyanobacterium MO_207.B15]
MSNLTESKNEKIFGIDFVFATICVALVFFGLAYVLSVLPGIQKPSSTCITGGLKYGLIATHILTFVLIPLAMRIFYQGLKNLGLSLKTIFSSQLGLALVMVAIASEIGWHVTQCWYYQNDFTMLNFMFYFFLISAFALWSDGLSQQSNILTRFVNVVFAIGLLATCILYPLGYMENDFQGNPSFKIPIYITLTVVFTVLTYRGYKLLEDWRIIFVPIFSVGVNLSFIVLLDKYGQESVLYNALFHILHDLAGTLAGVAIFTWLVYEKGIAQKNKTYTTKLTQQEI